MKLDEGVICEIYHLPAYNDGELRRDCVRSTFLVTRSMLNMNSHEDVMRVL